MEPIAAAAFARDDDLLIAAVLIAICGLEFMALALLFVLIAAARLSDEGRDKYVDAESSTLLHSVVVAFSRASNEEGGGMVAGSGGKSVGCRSLSRHIDSSGLD